jgi:anti-sigma-K factor RskA
MTERDLEREEVEVFARLERGLPRVTPPPALFDRILWEIESQETVVALRPKRPPVARWRLTAVATAAAVAIVAIGMALLGRPDAPTARATLEARSGTGVTGEAALYGTEDRPGRLELILRGVPASPAGHHYEVWVLPKGSDEMISVGTFRTGATEDVHLEFPLSVRGPLAAVDVSIEEDDGPEEHSETSLATGTFT